MLHDTVVIEGEVSLINQIDGDPDVFIGGGGSQPTGTKSILLTEAGTKTEDVASYASAEINAVTDATASGAVASFSDGAEDVPMDSCVVDIEPVQSGSGDPSPSNVRPISGWSAVKVSVAGKNLFTAEGESVGYLKTDGTVNSSSTWRYSDYIPVKPNTLYTFTPNSSSATLAKTWFYNSDKDGVSYIGTGQQTFTTPSDCAYMRFTYNKDSYDIQLELGSTATAYTPYVSPTEYPVSLGQTVYGGTLDVVTGVLTVDMAVVDMGSLTWSYSSAGLYFTTAKSAIDMEAVANSDMLCTNYRTVSTSGTHVTGDIWNASTSVRVMDTNYTDASTFKTAMSGVTLCYKVVTPTTVQLTPTEVKTLLGSNSVWADSGNISVGYKADIFLYADSLETIIDTLTGGA